MEKKISKITITIITDEKGFVQQKCSFSKCGQMEGIIAIGIISEKILEATGFTSKDKILRVKKVNKPNNS